VPENLKFNAIILGAGKPYTGISHSGLRHIDTRGSVLDWTIHAIKPYVQNLQFVGGYQIEKVFSQYPEMTFVKNSDWEKGGSLDSLFHATIPADLPLIVLYSDIIFRPETFARLCSQYDGSAIVTAVDSSYPQRYSRYGIQKLPNTEIFDSSEFIGISLFPPSAIGKILEFRERRRADLKKSHISALIQELQLSGEKVLGVDIAEQWSDLNIPSAVTKFIMGTKAETLDRLEDKLKSAKICPQIRFTAKSFAGDEAGTAKRICTAFPSQKLAVRSSALSEDSFKTANAGVFDSVLNVPSDLDSVVQAIRQVLKSYPNDQQDHQVFVQPMVQDVIASGVIMTRSLKAGAPYITVNYTLGSKTDGITSGLTEGQEQTLILYREQGKIPAAAPGWMEQVLQSCRELEFLLDFDALDIEFAVDEQGKVFILQARPIILNDDRVIEDRVVHRAIQAAVDKFIDLNDDHSHPAGPKAIFGIMPDWNPAEIIGTRPHVLAASLYDYLITAETWAQQRMEYGYQDMRPSPLMTLFCGQPYIDVRASLGSFTPAALTREETIHLVSFYLDWLESHPHLHDKIEFDVVPTCYALDFARWESRLSADGKIPANTIWHLKTALLDITNNAFVRSCDDFAHMQDIVPHHKRLHESSLPPLRKALAILDICKRYGTLNFAHLARSAFVAMTLLRSLVQQNFLSEGRMQEFLLSIKTVSSEFSEDAYLTKTGALTRADFIHKYGHLRPGTYDANCPRYDGAPEFYLDSALQNAKAPEKHIFALTDQEADGIDRAFVSHGLKISAADFVAFCRRSIEGREFSKFIFTRSLSDALELLRDYTASLNIPPEDTINIPLQEFQLADLGVNPDGLRDHLLITIEHFQSMADIKKLIELPVLISKASDFTGFFYDAVQANFVTQNTITENMVTIQAGPDSHDGLRGKIVLIDAADPGYDWIFGHDIGGLITKYGGANSHMAIRCAEFGIPAAIGIGEVLYRKLLSCEKVELNCQQKVIRIIR